MVAVLIRFEVSMLTCAIATALGLQAGWGLISVFAAECLVTTHLISRALAVDRVGLGSKQ
jgi:hypothetical protein